jgi:hypothetical protein
VLRENIVGEREELQKELDLVRKHSSISLKRFRETESVFKRGAFALVDASDALGKSKRDASISRIARAVSGHIAVNNTCKPPALLFAFRSIRNCLELRTWRPFWGPRGKILEPQNS